MVFELTAPQITTKSVKFPVFTLMIREFDAETGSHLTVSSAKQSAISAFSAEKSKIARTFAKTVRLKGTGESQFRPPVADYCSILSIGERAGALSQHSLPKNALATTSLSARKSHGTSFIAGRPGFARTVSVCKRSTLLVPSQRLGRAASIAAGSGA